jgi:hypothetical protein
MIDGKSYQAVQHYGKCNSHVPNIPDISLELNNQIKDYENKF